MPDHYPWRLLLRVGIAVSWWLTVAKSNTGKFRTASASFATSDHRQAPPEGAPVPPGSMGSGLVASHLSLAHIGHITSSVESSVYSIL